MHLHDPRKPHEEQAVHAERCESGTKHTPQQEDAQLDAPFITLRPPAASVAGAHEVVGECVPDCIPPLIFSGAFLVSAKPCGTHRRHRYRSSRSRSLPSDIHGALDGPSHSLHPIGECPAALPARKKGPQRQPVGNT
jgi:hypothetical protein